MREENYKQFKLLLIKVVLAYHLKNFKCSIYNLLLFSLFNLPIVFSLCNLPIVFSLLLLFPQVYKNTCY